MARALLSLAFLPFLLAPSAFLGGCGGQADDVSTLDGQPAAPAAIVEGHTGAGGGGPVAAGAIPAAVPMAAAASPASPVIAGMRMRDHILTVLAGEEGLRFRLAATGGAPVDDEMTLEDLQARHPGIYDHYRSAVASPAGGVASPAGGVLYAGL